MEDVNYVGIASIDSPYSFFCEAYKALRMNISLREFDRTIKTISVVSADVEEAKSTTAVNLAVVYGQLGKKVLLIDLDLRRPSIHKKLKLKNDKGITDVLARRFSLDKAVITYNYLFDVLLSGRSTPYSSELIQSQALRDLLSNLKNEYDIIIVDCPPVNLVTDGIIASTYCDGTILCVASGHDEAKDLVKAKDALQKVGVNLIGSVLTRIVLSTKNKNYNYSYSREEG